MSGGRGDDHAGDTAPLGTDATVLLEEATQPGGAVVREPDGQRGAVIRGAQSTLPLGSGVAQDDGALGLAATEVLSGEDTSSQSGAEASGSVPDGLDFELRPFGPYEQVQVLREQGSIGVVARGLNAGIGRWELLKFLRSSYQSRPEVVRQFRAEGKALALLSHPNVVQVFATYELDGRTCLALELLEGESLEARASRGPLGVEEGLAALLEAARGLAAVHAIGLLHRDIKPANLFITKAQLGRSGGLKLIDFGLAATDPTRKSVAGQDPGLRAAASGGTPLYMAPELWRGQDPLPASDVYALGLSFYFAFTGSYPFDDLSLAGVATRLTREDPLPSVHLRASTLPGPLAVLIDRTLSLAASQRPSADELVAQLVTLSLASAPPGVPKSGPYRGLAAFGREDRGVFFGREEEAIEICERLRAGAAVVLVGPAGSGKTSLALAGVAPAIEQGALGLGLVFQVEAIQLGGSPREALAAGLHRQLGVSADDIARLIAAQPERLGQAVTRALPAGRGLVVLIDALEDLLRADVSLEEQHQVATALGSLCKGGHPGLRLLATAPSEQMSKLSSLAPLRRALTHGYHPLRQLAAEQLGQLIEGPAARAGFRVEPADAPSRIVQGLDPSGLSLPLFSLALSEWWVLRDPQSKVLSERAWERLGGVPGAVARHAERVVEAFGAAEHEQAQEILVRLGQAGARGIAAADLAAGRSESRERALSQLLAARLVVEREGRLMLGSPALEQHWPRLRRWLTEAGEDRAFHQRLVEASAQWEAGGRSEGALWDGALAARLVAWFRATELPLSDRDLAFIQAVRRRATRSRALRLTAGLMLISALVGLLVVSRARETSLAARVERLTTDAATRDQVQQRRLGRLQTEIAEHRLAADPAGAVRAVRRAYDTAKDPALDLLGWRAIRAGIPRALPANPSGVRRVRFDPASRRVAVSWRDGALQILSVDSPAAWKAEPLAGPAELVWISSPNETALLARAPVADKTVKLMIEEGALRAEEVPSCAGDALRSALGCSAALEPERSAGLEPDGVGAPARGSLALPQRGLVARLGGAGVLLEDAQGEPVGGLGVGDERLTRLVASGDGRWLVALAASGRALVFDLDLAAPQVAWGVDGACRVRDEGCDGFPRQLGSWTAGEPQAEPRPARAAPGLVAWVQREGDAEALVVKRPGHYPDTEPRVVPLTERLLALTAADSGAVFTLDARGAIRRVEAAELRPVAELPRIDPARPATIALSLDEAELLVVQGEARLLRLSDGSERVVPNAPPGVSCGAFSRGGQALVLGTEEGGVWLYHRATHHRAEVSRAPRAITHCERLAGADRFFFSDGERHFSERYWLLPAWQLARPDRLERGAPAPWAGLAQYE
ncbi:MAG: serine/threonine-protein kinase PknK [Polyangiaceae bacterium]|nr:serine/threonine-protein kinase PknK [Polyangiaceae bacterium]MCW5791302.1 serine/threonine-protein kinase PknK [Polyangiaceae bacterium]